MILFFFLDIAYTYKEHFISQRGNQAQSQKCKIEGRNKNKQPRREDVAVKLEDPTHNDLQSMTTAEG